MGAFGVKFAGKKFSVSQKVQEKEKVPGFMRKRGVVQGKEDVVEKHLGC